MVTIPNSRDITAQLSISRPDGSTFVDVSEYLDYAEIELGNVDQVGTGDTAGDSVVRTMRFTLLNDREHIPVWDSGTSKDETYVVGDDADVVGDENDGAEALINLLFDTDNELKGNTFHPLDKEADWNTFSGAWNPLLWPLREVVLRVAIQEQGGYTQESGTTQSIGESVGTGDGNTVTFTLDYGPVLTEEDDGTQVDGSIYLDSVETSGYTVDQDAIPSTITFDTAPSSGVSITADYTYFRSLFGGYLGDGIKSVDGGSRLECECRDYAKLLQDTYIETVGEYGSSGGTAAETVIQNIMDDYMGSDSPTLYTPSSPGFLVTADPPYEVEYESVWDAIQKVASQIGWFLGYRWDDNTLQWRLTFMEPPRTKSSGDYTLTAEDDIYTRDLDFNDSRIRNAVTVVYREEETNERQSVTVTDSDSIDEFRRRPMQIEENETSLIDTQTEASGFADALLNDLKDITSTTDINMPLFPDAQFFTAFDVNDPRLESEVNFYATESVRHTLDFNPNGSLRTEIIAGGTIIGSKTKWLRMETRPGAGKPIQFPEQSTQKPPSQVKKFNVAQDKASLLFTWKPITTEPVTYQIRRGNSWDDGQIVADSIDNDTYSTKQILRGTNTYYIKAIDAYGNQSREVNQSTVAVNFLPEVRDIVTHDELDNIDGTMTNIVDLSDYTTSRFGLEHLYTWSGLSGTTWSGATDIKWESPVSAGEGTYVTQPVDMGSKIKAYVITNLAGTNEEATSRTLEISYSDSETTGYSDWEFFNGGQYEARYFKFKVTLVSAGNKNLVDNFDIELDAPEFTQRDTNVSISSGASGTSITFTESFGVTPAIVLTAIGDNSPRIISQSASGFSCKIVDGSGNSVGGNVNWSATAY